MVKGINSTNEYQVSNAGINQEGIQNKLSKSRQAVTDNFESNSAVKIAAGNTSDPSVLRNTLFLLPPLFLLNGFVDKLIGGSEDKSLVKKAANLGDRISHFLHLDNIVSEKNSSKIANFLKNNRFTKYFTKEYKAIPKASLAKSISLAEKYSQDLASNLPNLKYNINFANLFKQGADSLSPETLKIFESIGPLKEAVSIDYLKSVQKALDEILTKPIGGNDREVILKLQKSILRFMQNNIAGNGSSSTKSLAGQIQSALLKVKDGGFSSLLSPETLKVLDSVSIGGKDKLSSLSQEQIMKITEEIMSKGVDNVKKGSIISEPVALSTLRNKIKAVNLEFGQTVIGKVFAKGLIKTKDLLTFNGGLLGLAFTANAIIQAVKSAKEAPKGEKKSTFMHVLSEQYVGILLFQPSISMLYKAGGNKYRGMSIEGRNALKNLIENTNANKLLTKEGYKIAKLQKDLLLKGVSPEKVSELANKGLEEAKMLAKSLKQEGVKLKFWEKPLKLAGKILGIGLDKINAPSLLGKIGQKVKGFAGGLGRLLLILMVIQPIIQKPVTKLCHKIFGEPKAYLEKTKQENKSSDKNKTEKEADLNPEEETNLLKIYEKKLENINTNANPNGKEKEILPTVALKDDKSALNSQSLKEDQIAALNLFNKKSSDIYIPSIEVESYSAEKEKQLEIIAEEILKDTNETIKNARKVL